MCDHGVTFLESDINRDGGKFLLVAGAPRSAARRGGPVPPRGPSIVAGQGRLPLRAGVNHGRVFAGDFGPEFRRTYSIKGDAINVAARVMGKTPIGEVFATEAVLERLRRPVEAGRSTLPGEGHQRPVHASSVSAVGDDPDRKLTRRRVADGVDDLRRRELARAALAREVAAGQRGSRAGHRRARHRQVGVRRAIVQEAAGHRVFRGLSGHFGGAAAYNAVRRLLRDVAGVGGGTPREEQVAALHTLVADRCPDLLPMFPLLTIVLDAPVPDTPETRDLDERFRAAKLVEVVVTFLHAVLDTPSVLLFEDADEMDESSAAIVSELSEAAATRPWLVVLTRQKGPDGLRLGETARRGDRAGSLDRDRSEALLGVLERERPVSRNLIEAIAAKAGGNPLFMEALLDAAASGGRWRTCRTPWVPWWPVSSTGWRPGTAPC